MTYYPDFGSETMVARGRQIRAIGWLSNQHSFLRGESSSDFIKALRAICERWGRCVDALGWPVSGGPHTCEFCGTFRANGNVAVPMKEILFVAPEMISHYVEQHMYLPPQDFIKAVLSCPLPGTPEYLQAVEAFRTS